MLKCSNAKKTSWVPWQRKNDARQGISRLIDVEYIELDLVAFPSQGPGIPMKSHRELSEEVELILAKSSWIIDGVHTRWCAPLIFEADMVVWCHIKDEIRGDNRHPGWRRLKNSLPSVRHWYTRKLDDVRNHLDAMGLARSLSEHYVAELGDRMVRKSKYGP